MAAVKIAAITVSKVFVHNNNKYQTLKKKEDRQTIYKEVAQYLPKVLPVGFLTGTRHRATGSSRNVSPTDDRYSYRRGNPSVEGNFFFNLTIN